MIKVSLASPTILEFGPVHITNTVLGGLATTVIAIILIIIVARNPKLVPGRLQVLFEMMITTFDEFLISAYGNKKRARKYLPFYVTLFFFLLIANQFSILPLITNIVTSEGDFLFRMSTADFSQTIALALIAVVGAHIIAFSIAPIKHINNFFKFDKILAIRKPGDIPNVLLELFLGVLDMIGELAKVMSLSARLFGNIFAGDVMVAVIAGISVYTAYIVPIPFLFLGMFSSLVQAFVFAILCLNFMAGTIKAVDPEPTPALSQAS